MKHFFKPIKNFIEHINKQSMGKQMAIYLILFVILKFIFSLIQWLLWNGKYLEGFTGKPHSMTLLYWKNCGHCKKRMPEWDAFMSENHSIKVDKIEKDENPSLMEKLKIQSFPTILLLDENKNKIKEYDGERNLEAFKAFIKKYE